MFMNIRLVNKVNHTNNFMHINFADFAVSANNINSANAMLHQSYLAGWFYRLS